MRIKVTNFRNLPEPYVNAIIDDPYSSGDSDFTFSTLIQPARIKRLLEQYPEDCIEDASEKAAVLIGKAVHEILEKEARKLAETNPTRYIVEKRFYHIFAVAGVNYKVSAQIDLYDRELWLLDDYKTASAMSMKYGAKREHQLQLALQAFLLKVNGETPPTRLRITAIIKDWRINEANGNPNYPQAPAVTVEHDLIPDTELFAWVEERIRAHIAAKTVLPECTEEEMWAKVQDDEFAVCLAGNSKATKIFGTQELAEADVASRGSGYVVEARFGEASRCQTCPARRACNQWKASPRNPENKLKSVLAKKKKSYTKSAVLPDDMEPV